MKISAVILAAGKGTRMQDGTKASDIPKVMFEIAGKPMIRYAIENLKSAGIKDLIAVVGYKKELIQAYLGDAVEYAEQKELLGTGHAVMMAEDLVKGKSDGLLVCCGDAPLFKPKTIKKLIDVFEHKKPAIAMLSTHFSDPTGYGRIIRGNDGNVTGIVEQKDCDEDQLKITEGNPGFYIFNNDWFWQNVEKLKSNNAQHEYYLTDMVKLAKEEGKKIVAQATEDETEASGVNTLEQLKQAEKIILGSKPEAKSDKIENYLDQRLVLEARSILNTAKGCHDWDHTERVLNLAFQIGKKEKADLRIVANAAIMHDIGREEEEKSNRAICHAEWGSKMAAKLLTKLKYSTEDINQIHHCIISHRSKNKQEPESLEAKVLYDADKLDGIGAIGIGRAFVFSGEIGARVHDPRVNLGETSEYSRDDTAYRYYLDRLSDIKSRLLTEEGKKIAESRNKFMIDFFERLNKEALGKL